MLWSAGQFKTIEPHFSGECLTVSGLTGVEDITIHPRTGIAYLSACDRRAVGAGRPGGGGIYAYDLNAANPNPVKLTPNVGPDYQPHGISLYVGNNGQDALFVINHEGGRHTIDIFDIKNRRLIYRKTLSDPMLISPNDLVAVGPDRAYISNDHRYVFGFMRGVEDYLKLRLSNVVYYNGSDFIEVAEGIGYANGINVSHDGKIVYLCAVTELSLHVYDRDVSSGMLRLREKINMGTGVDNIEKDADGSLWIGSHPKLLTFVRHAKDQSRLSPSQVLHVIPRASGDFDIQEVYLNRGEEISGSSVAAVRKRRMLIGAVFDPKFLDCKMQQNP